MPAIMNRIENIDHMKLLAVGTLPTSGSCGTLLVYDFTSPGRAVTVAHDARSEEHTSELPSLMRTSSAVFCSKKKTTELQSQNRIHHNVFCTTKTKQITNQ